jgi:hypothetical protein
MRFPCWITKVTDTDSKYVMLDFGGKSGFGNAPLYYFVRTLPILSENIKRNHGWDIFYWQTFLIIMTSLRNQSQEGISYLSQYGNCQLVNIKHARCS